MASSPIPRSSSRTSCSWTRLVARSSPNEVSKVLPRSPSRSCRRPAQRPTGTVKAHLYVRYGVPWYWIVDPTGRAINAFGLRGGHYELAGRLDSGARGGLPPFESLVIDAGALLG